MKNLPSNDASSVRTLTLRIPASSANVSFQNFDVLNNTEILDVKDVTPTTGAAYNQSNYILNILNKHSLIMYQVAKNAILFNTFQKTQVALDEISLDSSSIKFDSGASNTVILLEFTYRQKN